MKLFDIILPQEILNRDRVTNFAVAGLCFDSREVKKGDVFFALSGTKTDGARFAHDAVKNGAVAVVGDDRAAFDVSVPVVNVADPALILAAAAARFFGQPTNKFYLSGVTGTCGKTTITYLLEKIWGKKQTGVMGTVNHRCGETILGSGMTTPDAITVQQNFAAMVRAGVTHAVAEVSSHALRQKRFHHCQLNSAVFTNLSQDHLDYHTDFEDYFAAKQILFNELLLQSQKANKLIVVNADDPYGQRLLASAKKTNNMSVESFSLNSGSATLSVRSVKYSLQGIDVVLSHNNQEIHLQSNLLGAFNLQNILAAFLVARHSGVSVDHILSTVREVAVPGRLQQVPNTNIFVDYAHKPNAVENVLTALRQVMPQKTNGRLMIVFGCGGDRDKTKRPLMGEIAARLADVVVITSDNPRTEDPQAIVDQILPGVRKKMRPYDGEKGFLVEVDRRSALKKAIDISRPDDVIVVAGKGHEDYQILGTEKIRFDDVEEIEKIKNEINVR